MSINIYSAHNYTNLAANNNTQSLIDSYLFQKMFGTLRSAKSDPIK